MDVSKAIDILDHNSLFNELGHFGTRDTALEWFTSYFTWPSQYVAINGVFSNILSLYTGASNGSILGLLLLFLFTLTIYPIVPNILIISLFFHADDLTLSLILVDSQQIILECKKSKYVSIHAWDPQFRNLWNIIIESVMFQLSWPLTEWKYIPKTAHPLRMFCPLIF